MLSQSSNSITIPEDSIAASIGITAPVDTSYSLTELTVTITSLPNNGTILLADGITPIAAGQRITVAQLIALKFRPTLNSFGNTSTLGFTVSDPAGATATGTSSLAIGPATIPLVANWTKLGVPQNSALTAIGIQGPVDANYAASALTVKVTGLPTNGTVYLSNGTTAVTSGETLTVAQLTGLLFKSASTGAGKDSSFEYTVSDPGGHTTKGRALLSVGPTTSPVTTATALTAAINSAAFYGYVKSNFR